VPQRTCVVCRTARAKYDLVRLTKPARGVLIIDQPARTPGRGAYLCRSRNCWTDQTTSDQLARALRHPLSDDDHATLHTFATTLPTREPERNPQ
jgi:predicted RNA-binding protein YlxR (DUF448 family)